MISGEPFLTAENQELTITEAADRSPWSIFRRMDATDIPVEP